MKAVREAAEQAEKQMDTFKEAMKLRAEKRAQATDLSSPAAGREEVERLLHDLEMSAEDLDCESRGAGDSCREAITRITADKAEIARLRAELSELTRMNNALEAVMIVQAEKLTLSRTLARAESAETELALLREQIAADGVTLP